MLNFYKNLKNSLGFSFVEILMAMSLLGICGLAVMKITDNTRMGSHQVEVVVSKSQFTFLVNKYLNSKFSCDELKQASPFSSTWTALSLDGFNVAGIEGNPGLPLASGRQFKTFRIKELSAKNIVTTGPEVELLPDSSLKTELVIKLVLEVFIEPGAGSASGTKGKRDESHFFNIPVVADGTKKIKNCDQFSSLESVCTGLRGSFDRNTNECKLENSFCIMRGGYVGPGSAQAIVNPLTGGFSCPAGTTPTPTSVGAAGIVPCSGKKCSGYEGLDIQGYICLDCPSGGGGGGTLSGVLGGSGGGGGGGGGSGSGSGP